jgi:hypothetical protein
MRKSRDVYDIDRSDASPATMCDINSDFHRLLAHIRSIGRYHNFFYHITTEFIALPLSFSWLLRAIPIWPSPASINRLLDSSIFLPERINGDQIRLRSISGPPQVSSWQ